MNQWMNHMNTDLPPQNSPTALWSLWCKISFHEESLLLKLPFYTRTDHGLKVPGSAEGHCKKKKN